MLRVVNASHVAKPPISAHEFVSIPCIVVAKKTVTHGDVWSVTAEVTATRMRSTAFKRNRVKAFYSCREYDKFCPCRKQEELSSISILINRIFCDFLKAIIKST
jgi:hypothetical protein